MLDQATRSGAIDRKEVAAAESIVSRAYPMGVIRRMRSEAGWTKSKQLMRHPAGVPSLMLELYLGCGPGSCGHVASWLWITLSGS